MIRKYNIGDFVQCRIITPNKSNKLTEKKVSDRAPFKLLKKNRIEEFRIIGYNANEYVIEVPTKMKVTKWSVGDYSIREENVPPHFKGCHATYVSPVAVGEVVIKPPLAKTVCRPCDRYYRASQRS